MFHMFHLLFGVCSLPVFHRLSRPICFWGIFKDFDCFVWLWNFRLIFLSSLRSFLVQSIPFSSHLHTVGQPILTGLGLDAVSEVPAQVACQTHATLSAVSSDYVTHVSGGVSHHTCPWRNMRKKKHPRWAGHSVTCFHTIVVAMLKDIFQMDASPIKGVLNINSPTVTAIPR